MAEYFFALSKGDQREALEQARADFGTPRTSSGKDIWVVWTLRTLFESPLGRDLTFKGGTSLSKAYKVIDRFSEDIDLTYDIRKLIDSKGDLPANRSQADKWTKAVHKRLPEWIVMAVQPLINSGLAHDHLEATIELAGREGDNLLLRYPSLTQGTGYISPLVTLEFGGRATGEPHQVMRVNCDAEGHIPGVLFPTAAPLVMSVARTFWEKITAAHVYCAQGRIRGERYARHWHDIAAIRRSGYFAEVIADRVVANAVARHKRFFFIEKDMSGATIDYQAAVNGHLKIVPEGAARDALENDYEAMISDDVMVGDALSFNRLMQVCAEIESMVNMPS